MFKYLLIIPIFWHSLFGLTGAFAFNSDDIIKMKEAGVSDKIIKKVISSNAISRAVISVDEIVEMKKAEIGDDIVLVIIEQSGANDPELDREEAEDRALKRKIRREEDKLQLQEKELNLLMAYISKLITNPEV